MDEQDVARTLLTLAASVRVEIDGKTGIPEMDAMLQAIGEHAGMEPIQDTPLQ